MKIVSWNLLYRGGARAADVAQIIEEHRPDLFLVQEATTDIDVLDELVGGTYCKVPWKGKSYALGAWVPEKTLKTDVLELPFSKTPGIFPPRCAQMLDFGDMVVANVHLSHGQLLNRRQLRRIARATASPLAIVGDFNAVGPVFMRGFKDVGPRQITHMAKKMVPFRLDRCFVRQLKCKSAQALERGRSDHRPIILQLTR